VVPAHELHRPAVPALQEEEDVATGPGLLVAPVGDVGVDDDVALGPLRRPLIERQSQGVAALVGPETRDLD